MEVLWPSVVELRATLLEAARSMSSSRLAEFRFRAGELHGVMALSATGNTDERPPHDTWSGDDPSSPPHREGQRGAGAFSSSGEKEEPATGHGVDDVLIGKPFHVRASRPAALILVLRSPEVGIWSEAPRGGEREVIEAGAVLGRVIALSGDEVLRTPCRGRIVQHLARMGEPVGVGEPLILWEVVRE